MLCRTFLNQTHKEQNHSLYCSGMLCYLHYSKQNKDLQKHKVIIFLNLKHYNNLKILLLIKDSPNNHQTGENELIKGAALTIDRTLWRLPVSLK